MSVRYHNADLDRSGQLDRDELKALLKSTIARTMSDPQLETYLKSQWHNVDKDGNGTVSFEEFLALYAWMKLEAKRGAFRRSGTGTGAEAAGAAGAAGTAGAAAGAAAGSSSGKVVGAAASSATASAAATSAAAASAKKAKKKRAKKTKKHPRKTFTLDQSRYNRNYISNEVVWSVIRTHNAFLVKRDGSAFSREAGNLRNLHNYHSSGLAHDRVVDVAAGDNGVSYTLRSVAPRKHNKPKSSNYSVLIKKDIRPIARRISAALSTYRPDLVNDALARATRVKQSLGGVSKKTQKTTTKRARRQQTNK